MKHTCSMSHLEMGSIFISIFFHEDSHLRPLIRTLQHIVFPRGCITNLLQLRFQNSLLLIIVSTIPIGIPEHLENTIWCKTALKLSMHLDLLLLNESALNLESSFFCLVDLFILRSKTDPIELKLKHRFSYKVPTGFSVGFNRKLTQEQNKYFTTVRDFIPQFQYQKKERPFSNCDQSNGSSRHSVFQEPSKKLF